MSTYTGNMIKKYRKEKGLTQKKLGELCGIADSNIRKYESGNQNPKIETLQKIADALDVNIYSLLNIEVEKGFIKPTNSLDFLRKPKTTIETTDENFVKIANCYHKLNREGRDKAIEQVELLTKIPEYKRITSEETTDNSEE